MTSTLLDLLLADMFEQVEQRLTAAGITADEPKPSIPDTFTAAETAMAQPGGWNT